MVKLVAAFLAGVFLTTGVVLTLSYCPTEDSCGYGYWHHIGYARKVTP